MQDNELFALIISTLNEQFATWPFPASMSAITVQQKNQPVKQGIPTGPAIFIEKLPMDSVHGSAAAQYKASQAANKLEEHETQVYISHFQISAAAIQKPDGDPALPTASDLANNARFILQRRGSIRKFAALGVGLLRTTEVRNMYVEDDKDRQESLPSFDLAVTYVRTPPVALVDKIDRVTEVIVQVPKEGS